MKSLVSIVFILSSLLGLAQFDPIERENQLAELLDTLRNAKTDEAKLAANQAFDKLMETTLNEPTVFDINFTRLGTCGVIDSPDKLVRIVNWNVELTEQVQVYNGYVITRSAINKEPRSIKLNYVRDIYNPKPTEVVDEENWYGALYYQIVPFTEGNKDSYILLGWNGGGMSSNIKLLDVLSFTSKGVKFGQSIFKTKEATLKRVFFEHSSQVSMSLKYEKEYDRIIFDHLSPESPNLVGFYEYYFPDMTYDAFQFGGLKLTLAEDVIGVNPPSDDITMGTTLDAKSGDIIMETVDNEWINPTSDGGAESEVHVAALPEGISKEDLAKEEKKREKLDKKNMTAQEIYDAKKHHKDDSPENSILNQDKRKKKH
jgi:hypothetical protein